MSLTITVDQRHGTEVDEHSCLRLLVPHDSSRFPFVIDIKSAIVIDCPCTYIYARSPAAILYCLFPLQVKKNPNDGVAIHAFNLELCAVMNNVSE